jgi:hypothetical protein
MSNKDGLRQYFLKRKAENEEQLQNMLSGQFRIYQRAADGTDVEMTDITLDSLRRAIKDYQDAADILKD